MKVNYAFKSKKEAFRERNSQKVKNDPFLLHLTLRFLDRDESRFLMKNFQNLVPNSSPSAISAQLIFPLKQGFHIFTFIYKRNEISMIWSPFAHFSSVTNGETPSSSRPRLHAGNSQPV